MSRRPRRSRIPTHSKRTGPPSLGKRRLDELVEEAIVDAYGESEQFVGLLCTLQQHLAVPFMTEILGTAVRVERVDVNDADEIVAICRRRAQRQTIPILDLPLPSPPPQGWEWIAAYRHWARGGR
jgi:Calcium binding